VNLSQKIIAATSVALASSLASAAGSPGVEHNTQAFLEAAAKGGGKPLEMLTPAQARQVNREKSMVTPSMEVSRLTEAS